MKLYTSGGYAGVRCSCKHKPKVNRAVERLIVQAVDRALAQHDGNLITHELVTDGRPLLPRDVFAKPKQQPEKQASKPLVPRGWL